MKGGRLAIFTLGLSLGLALGLAAAVLIELRDLSGDLARFGGMRSERSKLATRLMARVAPQFVATLRPADPISGGVSFFERPTGYGDTLCKVRTFIFDEWAVEGRRNDSPSREDLTTWDFYGVRAEPGSPQAAANHPDCAQFHDFSHLIMGDGESVERAVKVLSDAIAAARSGRPKFKLTCEDERDSSHPVDCDGLAILRQLSVRSLRRVRSLGSDQPREVSRLTATYWDLLDVDPPAYSRRGCRYEEDMSISVETFNSPGPRISNSRELKSLAIRRYTVC